MEDTTREALKCWGIPNSTCVTNDPTLVQDCTIIMMISNWIHNSLTETGLRCAEQKHNQFSCYRPDHRIYINDRPSITKVKLGLLLPEAKVKTLEMKDKLRTENINKRKGDADEILQDME